MKKTQAEILAAQMMHETARAYEAQITKMSMIIREWVVNNPSLIPQIQHNYPENAYLLATIGEAIQAKLVTVNKAGDDLIKHICSLFTESDEPTVTMLKKAFEEAG